ncbi:hypothetical protein CAEBREN_24350 [Caenorhabditis brenneri]|uniref:Uncharacterized protein n=1 Tax=Caenorhabditis brenneri TaxID=135651 RepID=G0NM13_CAEBE|nr:hypothetical protein CAEBREN_24350 [Caenorhabditis brenneri]
MTLNDGRTKLIKSSPKPIKHYLRLTKVERNRLKRTAFYPLFVDVCMLIACSLFFILGSLPPEETTFGGSPMSSPNRRATPGWVIGISIGSKIFLTAASAFMLQRVSGGRYKSVKQARSVAYVSLTRYLMILFDAIMIVSGLFDLGSTHTVFGAVGFLLLFAEILNTILISSYTLRIISELNAALLAMQKTEEQRVHWPQPLFSQCECGLVRRPECRRCGHDNPVSLVSE